MPVTNWGSSSVVTPAGNVFVYEALCGGSGIANGELLSGSLLREGAAMLQALLDDFCQLPEWQVWTLLDGRPGVEIGLNTEQLDRCCQVQTEQEHQSTFEQLVRQADAVLVVAPETDQLLLRLTRQVEQAGCMLLGPSSEWVAMAGDKLRLNHHLAAHGVPVPTCLAPPFPPGVNVELEPPMVRKPRFGAGADRLQRILDRGSWIPADNRNQITESYHAGLAVSVSALLQEETFQLLPAGLQYVDLEKACYQGGSIPLVADLQPRAASLASRSLRAMPPSRGFVGIDMVLGENPSGEDDVVIEINPRITTSYVGLRAAMGVNLATALLDCHGWQELPLVQQAIEFTARGEIMPARQEPLEERC